MTDQDFGDVERRRETNEGVHPPTHGDGIMREGRCLACGDEWEERDKIVVCPECGSLDVEEGS